MARRCGDSLLGDVLTMFEEVVAHCLEMWLHIVWRCWDYFVWDVVTHCGDFMTWRCGDLIVWRCDGSLFGDVVAPCLVIWWLKVWRF